MTSWDAATPPASSVASTGTVRLTTASAIAQLVMARGTADGADIRAVVRHGGTVLRQGVDAAVQVQEDQAARRVTQVVHAGHGLLALVAALVEVQGRADPVHLVRDRLVVGLETQPGAVVLDPQRLIRPEPGEPQPEPRCQPLAREQDVVTHGDGPLGQGGPRLFGHGDHGVAIRHVGDLDPQHEPHLVEERGQLSTGARLDMRPDGLTVVDEDEVVLHPALGVQQQRLGGSTGFQVVEFLRAETVEPAQTVGSGDPDDLAIAPVDHRLSGEQRALLGEQVAVVSGDIGVGGLGRDRAGSVQQRASHAHSLRGPAGNDGSGSAAVAAVAAAAEDRQVVHVGDEPELLVEVVDEALHQLRTDLADLPAATADQVHVIGLGGQMVGGGTVPQMGVGDHAELLKKLKGPVDGRDVHPASGLPHPVADLLWSGVLAGLDRLKHQLALRSDPVTARPQFLMPRRLGHAKSL